MSNVMSMNDELLFVYSPLIYDKKSRHFKIDWDRDTGQELAPSTTSILLSSSHQLIRRKILEIISPSPLLLKGDYDTSREKQFSK